MFANLFIILSFWGNDYKGDEFLNIGVGARPISMGGAYTGVNEDSDCLFWNPAGISEISELQFNVMGMQLFFDVNISAFSATVPLKRYGNIGIGIFHLRSNDIKRDVSGREIGEFSNYNVLVETGYALKIKKIGFGFSCKFIRGKLEDYTANSYYVDAGIQYDIFRYMKAGITLKNAGVGPKYYRTRDPAPTSIESGISFSFDSKYLGTLIAFDVILHGNMDFDYHTGFELGFGPRKQKKGSGRILLRGGYKSGEYVGDWSGFSIGMGYEREHRGVTYIVSVTQINYGFPGKVEVASLGLKF